MMGIGPIELIVILVVALLVLGPEKLPEMARALARVTRDLRRAMDEVRDQFEELTREDLLDTKEIDDYYKGAVEDVKKSVEAPEEIKNIDKELEETIQREDKPENEKEPDSPPPQPPS